MNDFAPAPVSDLFCFVCGAAVNHSDSEVMMNNISRYYKSAHNLRTSCASMPEASETDAAGANLDDMANQNKASISRRMKLGETVDDDRRGKIWHPKQDLDMWRAQIFEQLVERGHSIEDPDFVRCRSEALTKSSTASRASTSSRQSAESMRSNGGSRIRTFGASFKNIFQKSWKSRAQSLPF